MSYWKVGGWVGGAYLPRLRPRREREVGERDTTQAVVEPIASVVSWGGWVDGWLGGREEEEREGK